MIEVGNDVNTSFRHDLWNEVGLLRSRFIRLKGLSLDEIISSELCRLGWGVEC